MMRFIFVLLCVVSLIGCSYVPVAAMIQLSQLDPMTTDARQLRAAVRMPDGLQVAPKGVVLEMSVTRADINETIQESFALELIERTELPPALKAAEKPGYHLAIYRISEDDMTRLQAFRQNVVMWKEQSEKDTKGSLSVGASGCWVDGPIEGPLLTSVYLKLTEDVDYVATVKDYDLRDAVSQGGELALKTCREHS